MDQKRQFRGVAPVVAVAGTVMVLAGPISIPSLLALALGVLVLDRARADAGRLSSLTSGTVDRRIPRRNAATRDLVTPFAFLRRRKNGSKDTDREDDDEVFGKKASDDAAWADETFLGGLDDDEMEEISFLPPYASGESAEEEAEDPESQTWTFPGLAEDDVEVLPQSGPDALGNVPIPRHFALGTVAIIRKLLEPAEVAQILVEQKRQPKLRFGEIAVQLGLLTETQLQELLLAQQQGLFTDAEIREARSRLKAYRELEGSSTP